QTRHRRLRLRNGRSPFRVRSPHYYRPERVLRAHAPQGRPMNKRIARTVLSLVGIVLALASVFPVYWMWTSSLRSNHRLQRCTPNVLPAGGSFANYPAVFSRGTFFDALGMSLAITLLAVGVCILFAFFAALAISRFRFRGRTSFVVAVLVVQMLPAE